MTHFTRGAAYRFPSPHSQIRRNDSPSRETNCEPAGNSSIIAADALEKRVAGQYLRLGAVMNGVADRFAVGS